MTSCKKTVDHHGYALIPGFAEGLISHAAARLLGSPDHVEGLSPTQALTPQLAAPPNTYSGNFGFSEFPLHTDLAHWVVPPRYLMLRCVKGFRSVLTRILDGTKIIDKIGADNLRSALVQPRRPMQNGKQLLRLLESTNDDRGGALRWDSLYLRPASPVAIGVYDAILSFISQADIANLELANPDDTLIIDNWRCLHGRSSLDHSSSARRIDRVYLKELR